MRLLLDVALHHYSVLLQPELATCNLDCHLPNDVLKGPFEHEEGLLLVRISCVCKLRNHIISDHSDKNFLKQYIRDNCIDYTTACKTDSLLQGHGLSDSYILWIFQYH